MKLGGGRKMKVDFQASFCLGVMESEDRQKGKPTRDPSEVATTEMDQEWPEKVRTHTHGSRYSSDVNGWIIDNCLNVQVDSAC